ncbi:enolase C-terminal domain-like protein [Cupriavidus basilensis]
MSSPACRACRRCTASASSRGTTNLRKRACRLKSPGTPRFTCVTRRNCSARCAKRSASRPTLHDAHHRLTPIEAARLGKELEPCNLFWLEDATPAENQDAFRLIRQHTTTPLAVGEVFNSIWDCKDLISNQLIDHPRHHRPRGRHPTAHVRRIADFAAMYQVRTGFHGATDPVAGVHGRRGQLRGCGRQISASRS